MARAHNFSAGPAVLPVSVIEQLQAALPEFGRARAGIMEISHRSSDFDAVIGAARERLRRVMAVPDDYSVLFLQGGASLQFFMSALNIAGPEDRIDYICTGQWSKKAVKEAGRVCDAANIWSSAETGFDHVPSADAPLQIRVEWARHRKPSSERSPLVAAARLRPQRSCGGPPLGNDAHCQHRPAAGSQPPQWLSMLGASCEPELATASRDAPRGCSDC